MNVWLLYPDRDFDQSQPLPPNADDLMQDLEVPILLKAMAEDDAFLYDIARRVLLESLHDPAVIRYRQQVFADCLAQADLVRSLFALAGEALKAERAIWGAIGRYPSLILHRSLQVMEAFVPFLKRLRTMAEDTQGCWSSPGFMRFFAMIRQELDDDFFQTMRSHLRALQFRSGMLIGATLGGGNKGQEYRLLWPQQRRWFERLMSAGAGAYHFAIAERDESGFSALEELRGRGINLVANALAQSVDHILAFFRTVQAELAFYLGCLHLHARLHALGMPTSVPVPVAADHPVFTARDLYDPCLTLQSAAPVVGNTINADGKQLVIITGANQGGKSTLLRGVGVAQMMLHAGMFVPASALTASVTSGIFTHFKREEDAQMQQGKLAEELHRMSGIVDQIAPGGLLLCNESFAATNEREGSQIAWRVIQALIDANVTVFFVTHLYDFAQRVMCEGRADVLFLRAERQPDGQRTYRVREGEPLPTSYGADAYARIFRPDVDKGG
jgi:hypothetical protein